MATWLGEDALNSPINIRENILGEESPGAKGGKNRVLHSSTDTKSQGPVPLALQAPGTGSWVSYGVTPSPTGLPQDTPLLQGLGVYGFPFSLDLFWTCSAPGQAGKGAEACGGWGSGAGGGRRVARRKLEEAGGG